MTTNIVCTNVDYPDTFSDPFAGQVDVKIANVGATGTGSVSSSIASDGESGYLCFVFFAHIAQEAHSSFSLDGTTASVNVSAASNIDGVSGIIAAVLPEGETDLSLATTLANCPLDFTSSGVKSGLFEVADVADIIVGDQIVFYAIAFSTSSSASFTISMGADSYFQVPGTWAATFYNVRVPAASLSIGVNQPAVSSGASIPVPAASLSIGVNQPEVSSGASIPVPASSLSIGVNQPAVSSGVSVPVPVRYLSVEVNPPSIAAGEVIQVPFANIGIEIFAPDVFAGASVSVGAAAVAVAATPPTLASGVSVAVGVSAVSIASLAPFVSAEPGATIAVPALIFSLAGQPPRVLAWSHEIAPAAVWADDPNGPGDWTNSHNSSNNWVDDEPPVDSWTPALNAGSVWSEAA